MFGRSKSRTHSEQLMDELSQSYGHLKMAAAHAAGGAAERVTPSYDKARVMAARRWNTTKGTFSPLYDQIREGAANARGTNGRREPEMKRNKWPVVIGLVAAGAAAGAAGAMIARRRRVAAQWDEYDPMPSLEESPYGEHTLRYVSAVELPEGGVRVYFEAAAETGGNDLRTQLLDLDRLRSLAAEAAPAAG